jgi:hypothetical protein
MKNLKLHTVKNTLQGSIASINIVSASIHLDQNLIVITIQPLDAHGHNVGPIQTFAGVPSNKSNIDESTNAVATANFGAISTSPL